MTDTITTELRESMVDDARGLLYIGETALVDLCDAIDAVHANLEAENESLRRELDRVLGEQDRDGWVRLPVDADGVPIRVGDVMEADYGTTFEVEHISLYQWGWRCVGEGTDRSGVTCTAHAIPDGCRHYHEPTVEDVLREFAVEVCSKPALTIRSGVVEEYAAKLRLAGES